MGLEQVRQHLKKWNKDSEIVVLDTSSAMVEPLVGHPVGGVCPFGINKNVRVFLDDSLRKFGYIYPACGNRNSAIKLSIAELE